MIVNLAHMNLGGCCVHLH